MPDIVVYSDRLTPTKVGVGAIISLVTLVISPSTRWEIHAGVLLVQAGY